MAKYRSNHRQESCRGAVPVHSSLSASALSLLSAGGSLSLHSLPSTKQRDCDIQAPYPRHAAGIMSRAGRRKGSWGSAPGFTFTQLSSSPLLLSTCAILFSLTLTSTYYITSVTGLPFYSARGRRGSHGSSLACAEDETRLRW